MSQSDDRASLVMVEERRVREMMMKSQSKCEYSSLEALKVVFKKPRKLRYEQGDWASVFFLTKPKSMCG